MSAPLGSKGAFLFHHCPSSRHKSQFGAFIIVLLDHFLIFHGRMSRIEFDFYYTPFLIIYFALNLTLSAV